MTDKDINIHVRAKGTEQADQNLKNTGQATEQLGKKTEQAGKKADGANKQLSGMSRILSNLKTQIIGMGVAWLSWQGLEKILNGIIKKLERIRDLMSSLSEQSLTMLEVGQSLEFQTGTVGQQKAWAQKAAHLQKSGSLRNIGVAGQMMVAGDIAFGAQGGIQNQGVMDMLQSIAPFVGSADLSGQEVSKLFEFAQTANVAATPEAWQEYLSKLQAGFTASKATSFGDFMVGLQKGGTPYIASGGSLEEAVSLFSGARSVTSNEALAGTLLEQVTRLSGGAYEKPRLAMEQAMGVNWSDISTDQRAAALLQYAQRLPDSQRSQFLAEAGFAPELINQLGRLVTPGGLQTIASTRQKITSATPSALAAQTDAYMQSDLGKQYQEGAKENLFAIRMGPKYIPWEQRLQRAKRTFKEKLLEGTDRKTVLDKHEPTVIALQQLIEDLKAGDEYIPMDDPRFGVYTELGGVINDLIIKGAPISNKAGEVMGQRAANAYDDYSRGTTNIHYHNDVIYNRPEKQATTRTGDLN